MFGAKVKIIGKMNIRAKSSTQEVSAIIFPQFKEGEYTLTRNAQLKLVAENEAGKEFLYFFLAEKIIRGLSGHEASVPNIPIEFKFYG